MLILIYLIYLTTLFYWQINKVKAGSRTKLKAVALHAAYTFAPVVLYGVMFMLLVGVEEFTDTAIIGEGYARTLVFVLAGGLALALLATLIFSLVVLTIKQRNINTTSLDGKKLRSNNARD